MKTLLGPLAVAILLTACSSEPEPAPRPVSENAPRVQAPTLPEPTRKSDTSPTAQALRTAAMEGRTETVQQMIAAGADVNAADPDLRTALMLAAFDGHSATVKLLLESGARVSDRDVMGRDALMFASTGAFTTTVELLLKTGANPNAVDDGEAWTALMFAAGEGQMEVVETLLRHGADPNLTDLDGDMAADHARNQGHEEVASLLEEAMTQSP